MKLTTDYQDTDASPKMPASLRQELDNLDFRFFKQHLPVLHQLKTLAADFSAFPQPACLLAKAYAHQHKYQLAMDILLPLKHRFPASPELLTTLGTILLEQDDFEAMEQLADFSLPFSRQFPGRSIAALEEWLPYELLSLEWLLVNEEMAAAFTRIRDMAHLLDPLPPISGVYQDIIETLETCLLPDEYSEDCHDILQLLYRKALGVKHYTLPAFQYSQLNRLLRPLSTRDIPELLKLQDLPRQALLPELRMAIRDMYFNDYYYRNFAPEDIQPDLAMAGFLLLAEMGEPGDLEEWLAFLRKPADFIDFWLGDLLNECGYWVSWKLGRRDLPAMETALRQYYAHEWSAACLATGLIVSAYHEAGKMPEILDIFERTSLFILSQPPDRGTENLLPLLIQFGISVDQARFIPLLQESFRQNRILTRVYGDSPEKLVIDAAYWTPMEETIEYKRSLLPLDEFLHWFLT